MKICASILPKTADEALMLIEKAENQGANFIEVRLDRLKKHNKLLDITSSSKLAKIAANRSLDKKGFFSGSEEQRKKLLLKAANKGFEYIDLELSVRNLKKIAYDLRSINVKPIISFHDFNNTPGLVRLEAILEKEAGNGAEVCKIVTTAKSIEDNITVLSFVHKVRGKSNIICFSMGELGKTSRILSPVFGGFFTIACVEKKKETAAGQMTVREMKAIYRALEA